MVKDMKFKGLTGNLVRHFLLSPFHVLFSFFLRFQRHWGSLMVECSLGMWQARVRYLVESYQRLENGNCHFKLFCVNIIALLSKLVVSKCC